MLQKKNISRKYLALSLLFTLVCMIFVSRLINLQFNKEKTENLRAQSEITTETEVIWALRGNICDRNGKVLVTTSYSYDIIFDYNYMPSDFVEFNRTILSVLDAINDTQSNGFRTSDLYPFAGEYPNISYSTEATTVGTATYNALNKMLSDLKMEGASAKELSEYFVKRWKFNQLDKDSNPIYTNDEIGKLLRVRYDMLRTQFSSITPYCIATGVDISLVTYIKELGIVGVSDKISSQRTYIYPGYASHILGRVGGINADTWEYYKELGYSMDELVGIDGCEKQFEEYLRGQNGLKTITRNGDGEIIKEEITKEPVAGKDVWLTIDIDLQIATEDALKTYMENHKQNSGASVSMDPNTGEILAIASYPTYDLTTFSKDYNSLVSNPYYPLINRAIGATYPPGSTLKIATAIAALESGAVTQNTTLYCNHGYHYHGMNVGCDNHSIRYLNIIDAIAYSCNSYFIEVGYDNMDMDVMKHYCINLGLGQITGIELPEKTGRLAYNDDDLTPHNEALSYIGQSTHQFTPLQVNSYMATVANGGTRYAANILHSVRTFSGEIVYKTEKTVLSTVDISESTLNIIKTGMKEMVDRSTTATENMYLHNGITEIVCGKSGTAQVGDKEQHCWFTAFAPMENPQIVVTSMTEYGDLGAYVSEIDAAVIAAYLNR